MRNTAIAFLMAAGLAAASVPASAEGNGAKRLNPAFGTLKELRYDASRGRRLFVTRGCVICHAVNRVGGSTGPALDSDDAMPKFGILDFAAQMWRGAEAMIALQKRDLGFKIELTGQEIADLAAFVNDKGEQKMLRADDIPPVIQRMMRERDL